MIAAKLMVLRPPRQDGPSFERVYQDEHVHRAAKQGAGTTKLVATEIQ